MRVLRAPVGVFIRLEGSKGPNNSVLGGGFYKGSARDV